MQQRAKKDCSMILDRPNIHIKKSEAAFAEFQASYNKDLPSREKLKTPHANMFTTLLKLTYSRMWSDNKKFSDNSPQLQKINIYDRPSLRTNNKTLRGKLNVIGGNNDSTVIRHAKRLQKAGALIKINHGTELYLEFIINPFLVYLFDNLVEGEFTKDESLKCVTTSLPKAFIWAKLANCQPFRSTLSGNYNKVLIEAELQSNKSSQATNQKNDKEFSEENNLSKGTSLETMSGNAVKKTNSSLNASENLEIANQIHKKQYKKEKKNVWAASTIAKIDEMLMKSGQKVDTQADYYKKVKAEESKVNKFKLEFAADLLYTFIAMFHPNFKLWPSYANQVINYIATYYFSGATSREKVTSLATLYQKRLQLAKTHSLNHPDYRAPYPMKYFDVENSTNSFTKTKQFLKNKNNNREIDKQRKNSKSDMLKYTEQQAKYFANPSRNQFDIGYNYCTKNIPHLAAKFMATTIYAEKNMTNSINNKT